MLGSTLLIAAAAVAIAPTALAGQCQPQDSCTFQTDVKGKTYNFDISSGCSADKDYVAQDAARHTYNFNICGQASYSCLPQSWTNNYQFGAAVQSWGTKPACPPMNCVDKNTSQPACCSADCQVLGLDPPLIRLMDPANPATGGLVVDHHGVAASDSDPFWCNFNPATGAQYERQVTYNISCDAKAATPSGFKVVQNQTNDCHYTVLFDWAEACGTPPTPPTKCVHGKVSSSGQCVCDPYFTGSTCNTTTLACSQDKSVCNTCSGCCANYGQGTCVACAEAECLGRVCDVGPDCTACPKCCQAFLKGNQAACNACVMAQC